MDCLSESESELHSPSLPSLPTSLQQQLHQKPKGQEMTVKEIDEKLAELRRENFNLKLRLYFVEKEKNGITKPEYESVVAKEMVKREKTIKALHKIVADKEEEIETLKNFFDDELKKRDLELELIKSEKENLLSDLQVNASVCRSLMSHLCEIRDYWQNQLMNSSTVGVNDLMTSLSNWLNTSDDLLNSASVLIGDDCANSFRKESHLHDISQTGNFLNKNFIIFENNGDAEQDMYLKYKEQLYHMSSDSEDEWSEPDREASKARIGIQSHFVPEFMCKSPPKPRNKRRSSGMSSLGLLSNISEIMNNKSRRKTSKSKYSQEAQTDLTLLTLDAILRDYQSLVNKQMENNCTQTEVIQSKDNCAQTYPLPMKRDKEVETDGSTMATHSTQVDVCFGEIQVQTESRLYKDSQTQTQTFAAVNEANVNTLSLSDEECLPFAEIKAKSATITGGRDVAEGSSTGVKTLYTYKAMLSPVKKSPPSSPTSIKTFVSEKSSSNSLLKTKTNLSSKQSLHHNDTVDNICSSVPKSFPSSPIKQSHEVKESLSNPDCVLFKMPNDRLYAKVKKATISKSSRISLMNKDILLNKNTTGRDKASDSLQSSSSSSSVDGKLIPRSKALSKTKQSLNLEVAKVSELFNNPDVSCPLSSPDLGLGDSDQDLNGSLRAYLSLSNYQLLRCNLNAALSILNSMESVSRDFGLQLVNVCDYFAEMKTFVTNMFQLITCAKNICRTFNLEDIDSLMLQLEKMKSRKENMEKAITRQLIKTDKLLKKAKVNLKDN